MSRAWMYMWKILKYCLFKQSSPTSQLELNPVAVVLDLQFTLLIMNYCLDKSLYPELEVSSCQQNVFPNVFMCAGVFLKEIINCYSINSAFFMASHIDISYMMIFQESCEVFRIPGNKTFVHQCNVNCTLYSYLLSPHDRVKKMWKGPTFSNIAFSSILLTLQYLEY